MELIPLVTQRRGVFRPKRTDDLRPGMADLIGRSLLLVFDRVGDDESTYPGQARWRIARQAGVTEDQVYCWIPEEDLEFAEWPMSELSKEAHDRIAEEMRRIADSMNKVFEQRLSDMAVRLQELTLVDVVEEVDRFVVKRGDLVFLTLPKLDSATGVGIKAVRVTGDDTIAVEWVPPKPIECIVIPDGHVGDRKQSGDVGDGKQEGETMTYEELMRAIREGDPLIDLNRPDSATVTDKGLLILGSCAGGYMSDMLIRIEADGALRAWLRDPEDAQGDEVFHGREWTSEATFQKYDDLVTWAYLW